MILLVIFKDLLYSLATDVASHKETRKWSNLSVLKIIFLNLVCIKEFVRLWSIVADAFDVPVVSLFGRSNLIGLHLLLISFSMSYD